MGIELFTNYSQNTLLPVGRGQIGEVQAADYLYAVNAETAEHGLVLREEEIRVVVEARRETLMAVGRVDFSGELPAKLARAFCDSPYAAQSSWASLLSELIELFYDIKNTYDAADTRGKTAYALADDALIARMRRWFDYPARGSVEHLQDLLSVMAERLQWGMDADEPDRRSLLFCEMDIDEWLGLSARELAEEMSRLSDILDAD